MNNSEKLLHYYTTELKNDLTSLEEQRKKVKTKAIVTFLLIALLTLVALILTSQYAEDGLGVGTLLFEVIAGYILGAFAFMMVSKGFVREYKLTILPSLIKQIDPQATYSIDNHISQSTAESSGLFRFSLSKVAGSDLVQANYHDVAIEFSNLTLEHSYRDEENNKTTTYVLFSGLFIAVDFNKNFKTNTIVLPESEEKKYGTMLGQWIQSRDEHYGSLVKMDNPEFEKIFVVYAADQIEARYILTPSTMERILKFKASTNQPILFAFNNSKLYIGIATGKDFFAPKIFKSLFDTDATKEYAHNISFAINIIDDLKLNERLWG